MTIEHNTVGSTEKRAQAVQTVKAAIVKQHLEQWVFTPGFWLLHSILFGVCFGVLGFLTVLGVRLALKF